MSDLKPSHADMALDDIARLVGTGAQDTREDHAAGNYRASNAEIQRLHKEVDRHFAEGMRLSHDLGFALGQLDRFKEMARRATKGDLLGRQLAASILVNALLVDQ